MFTPSKSPVSRNASSPGARFRAALAEERPLQIVRTINANHALLAQRAGYRAIYLSGAGVSAFGARDSSWARDAMSCHVRAARFAMLG